MMQGVSWEFDGWYERLHPRLVVALVAAFGDGDIAADSTDEAFVRAYERWAQVSVMASPAGWVFQVGFNVARRRLRRRAVEDRLLRRRPTGPTVAGPAGEVWSLVAALPPRQRQAVVLRHVAQLTETEVGQVMGIGRGSVSATLRAAYRSLRHDMTSDTSTDSTTHDSTHITTHRTTDVTTEFATDSAGEAQ